MKKAIIGKKVGMTQVFLENGDCIPVTVILAGPCPVIAKKTVEKDGYSSLVLGFEAIPERKLNKAELGQFKKANLEPMRTLKEFKLDDAASAEVGKVYDVAQFATGDKVDVCGTTRGRGYTGVIQRWNQHRLMMTHGVRPVHREVGSMGANSDPSRVMKLKKMPGRYGHERVTIQNLQVVKVDLEKNVLLVKGAVPGPKGSLVTVVNSVKAKN
ncbi:MAG: 50S ribosomal protein L3 [Clostridia bacterium]|nr:50S ribosomal protein L3 [Clostridia bacterium]